MKHTLSSIIVLIALFTSVLSCRPKADQNVNPEVSKLEIKRFEQTYVTLDTNRLSEELAILEKTFPPFLEGADVQSEEMGQYIRQLLRDTTLHRLVQTINAVYPNLDALTTQLSTLFSVYHGFFPQTHASPDIYSFISFLDYENRVIYQDSFLLIALDMYLYPNFKDYPLPLYIRDRLTPDHLPIDVAKAVTHYQLYGRPLKTLLDHIVFQGSVQCFIEALLPDSKPEHRLGMSKEQYNWCKRYEEVIWDHLTDHQLLYEQDFHKYKHWVNEGPNTPVLPGSPGRLASYVGWRMVSSYLKAQKATLSDLLLVRDSRIFLKESNYRP